MSNADMNIETASDALDRVRDAVRTRVLGQENVIDELLVTFLARGHALLEGVPGTAKTLLVRVAAGALGVRFKRIQFTPDLMPSDVTGVGILRDLSSGFEFRPGPIFTDLLLGDEINRAPPKTQAALLEAMGERQVTADGVNHQLGMLFTVFATQNPVEHEGTYPLPEAQLDRFLMKISVGYPSSEAEVRVLDMYADGFDAERESDVRLEPVVDESSVASLRNVADSVTVAAEIRGYVAALVRATRDDTAIVLGASPRASVALFRAARAKAVIAGRDYVTPDDVKTIATAVLRHRIRIMPELEVEGRSADDVIGSVLSRIAVPR
ncbi:MAG TPA: MoxR family ATPase [Gemmatimonadaceae bacterium]|nr:MoxR family ATPase [Gemmatimonadaceae bacterium]